MHFFGMVMVDETVGMSEEERQHALSQSVIVRSENGGNAALEAALEPFSEWLNVEPYDRPCSCEGDDRECEDCNGDGTYRSTYNQKSKWDWYVVGGDRWSNSLTGDSNIATLGQIRNGKERIPYFVLTPDGVWHERWDNENHQTKSNWTDEFKTILSSEDLPDHLLVYGVDIHS